MPFISRAYNSFTVSDNMITKQSSTQRLQDEFYYYSNIPAALSLYYPRVVGFMHDTDNDFRQLKLEYYAYDNLGNLMINQPIDTKLWTNVIDRLFRFVNESRLHTANFNQADVSSMYINKTVDEYGRLLAIEPFEIFKGINSITLNGVEMKSFDIIWPKIKRYLLQISNEQRSYHIHGDLCFSNILYGINPITKDLVLKMIDPRGYFGSTLSYGDSYYDLAKMLHSIDGGYEYFITDNFKLSALNHGHEYELIYSNDNRTAIKSIFEKHAVKHNFNLSRIKALQGIIYIGMCARHYDSVTRQTAMLLTGLRLLNEVHETIITNN